MCKMGRKVDPLHYFTLPCGPVCERYHTRISVPTFLDKVVTIPLTLSPSARTILKWHSSCAIFLIIPRLCFTQWPECASHPFHTSLVFVLLIVACDIGRAYQVTVAKYLCCERTRGDSFGICKSLLSGMGSGVSWRPPTSQGQDRRRLRFIRATWSD